MKLEDISKIELYAALVESVSLQSHYAMQLNMWDGGKRMEFVDVDHWIARLREVGKLPPNAKES